MDALIHHLEDKNDLTPFEIEKAATLLLDCQFPDRNKERLLEALSKKGETPAEIAGFVEAFLKQSIDPGLEELQLRGPTLDVCGTGGDQLDLFNISTTTMFIAAAAGAVVVKHGNRGITSRSGGADVLEALGVRIDLSVGDLRKCVEATGLGFMFAPHYHPAFKAVVRVRKTLAERGVKTIFNLIGPLLNPAKPECQLVGVFSRELCPAFAEILQRLGRRSAWVVNGDTQDGRSVDEISIMGSTQICKAGPTQGFEKIEIYPHDFGMKLATVESLQGGDAKENASILEAILSGSETGPKRDMVLLNAGAALTCAGLASDMHQAVEQSQELISNGAALNKLHLLRKFSAS